MMSRDLSALPLCAVMIDGIHVGEYLVLVAIGIDEQGEKHVLALYEGATENATVCTALVAQLAHLRRRHPRSETLDRIERQLVLPLDGLTVPSAAKTKQDTTSDDDKKKRRRQHPGRGAPPSHLQRVPVFNRVPAELRVCPQCGAMTTPVSHSSCLLLNVIPARVFVEERLDETIACPNDDTIVSASPPPQIVERGKLADTLIVEAVCDKYIEHLPIERQCARFTRAGVDVSPQTLGRSVSTALDLLAPVARCMRRPIMNADFAAS